MNYSQSLALYLSLPSKRREIRSDKEIAQFRHYVLRFIGESNITDEKGTALVLRITEWLNAQSYSSSTMAWVRGMLVQFFWWVGALDVNDRNRIPRMPVKGATAYSGYTLSEKEIGSILRFFLERPNEHHLATVESSLRNASGVCLLALTGIRISQMTAIESKDVEYNSTLQQMIIRVERQKNIEQTVKPIAFSTSQFFDGVSAGAILERYMGQEIRYRKYLFSNENGGKLSEEYWRKILRQASAKLDIERCNPHAFRAFVATKVAKKHGVLAAAQVLDHSSVNTTMRYVYEPKSTLEYLQ